MDGERPDGAPRRRNPPARAPQTKRLRRGRKCVGCPRLAEPGEKLLALPIGTSVTLFPVPVHVAEDERPGAVCVRDPSFERGRHVLARGVGRLLGAGQARDRHDRSGAQHTCEEEVSCHRPSPSCAVVAAFIMSAGFGPGVATVARQKRTADHVVVLREVEALAAPGHLFDELLVGQRDLLPRSMNMFATERLPEPCQFLGSGTFLFDGELSM